MPNPIQTLTGFALGALPTAPIEMQRDVYRALAELTPAVSPKRQRYAALAAHCEKEIAERDARAAEHQQLVLDFKRGVL